MRLQNILFILLFAVMIGFLFVAALGMSAAMPAQDLAQYWAAAHLAWQNPYSLQSVTAFERSFGVSRNVTPMVLRSPPWAVVVVLPLALFNYQMAYAAWALMSIVVVAGCARAAWNLFDSAPSLAPAFLSLAFGPTICLLMLGQIAVLVLLGVTLFLVMVERERDWLAGAALLLVLLKPHIAALFLLTVALWSFHCKRWKVLVSAFLTLVAASFAALAINPHMFTQYLHFAREFVRETTPYPNLGGILYAVTGRHSLAFLPQTVAAIWTGFYWHHHRANWDWKTDGVLVLVVSLWCSYYSFPFDEVVLLPALMAAFANGNRRVFLAGFVAANVGYLLYLSNSAGRFGFGPLFLWWTASAWLITYLLSRRAQLRSVVAQPA
jgi:hypothetical protein